MKPKTKTPGIMWSNLLILLVSVAFLLIIPTITKERKEEVTVEQLRTTGSTEKSSRWISVSLPPSHHLSSPSGLACAGAE